MLSQLGTAEKTPKAVLHEFCRQNGQFLYSQEVPNKIDSKKFAYFATAFDLEAIGTGRSKKEAEHEVCAKLIAKLAELDQFKRKFQKMPEIPRPTSDDADAVMTLRNICVQRNWPLPTFELMQSSGQPHCPMFTYVCQLASIKRTGTFSTKKGAKQLATREMIEAVQNFEQNDEQKQIATVDAEPVEKTSLTYYELQTSKAKLWAPRVRSRHKYFLQLPKENRNEAEKILMDNSSDMSAKDRIGLVCAALKLDFDVTDIPNHPQDFKVFHLLGNHDCVIAAKETDLYDQVISHFKTMLNLQKF